MKIHQVPNQFIGSNSLKTEGFFGVEILADKSGNFYDLSAEALKVGRRMREKRGQDSRLTLFRADLFCITKWVVLITP